MSENKPETAKLTMGPGDPLDMYLSPADLTDYDYVPLDDKKEICENCRFFCDNARVEIARRYPKTIFKTVHECRKNAPGVDGFPDTKGDKWCGEFEWETE